MTGKRLCFQEIEQIKILRASGLSFHAISQEIQRDPKTIKKTCLDPMVASGIKEIQEELADAYEGLARRMIDSIAEEDIQKINAYQRTIASGICTDKMRLLRNESTENISMQTLYADLEDLEEREIVIQKKIQEIGKTRQKTHNPE
jgi:hypothetical protein